MTRSPDGRGIRSAVLVVAALACLLATPIQAKAAALTHVGWSVSDNQAGATGVTYTYSFTTSLASPVGTITFAVSGTGLGGTPAIERSYGIPAGSVARSGQIITYTVATPRAIEANVPVSVVFSGLTNGEAPGTYTTDVRVGTSAPTQTAAVELAATRTTVTVNVARTLTSTLTTDPSAPGGVAVAVQTNAGSGYTIAVDGTIFTATPNY